MRRADGNKISPGLGIVVMLQADGFPAGEGRGGVSIGVTSE